MSVLDVGCGDGLLAALVMRRRPDLRIRGVDILHRETQYIPVDIYDKSELPYGDESFDSVMFVDVLHHSDNPAHLLNQAIRVGRKIVIIKDHVLKGTLAAPILRFMDYIGNARHGVGLAYNYLSEEQWKRTIESTGLSILWRHNRLNLYPWPSSIIFDRSLHFLSMLKIEK